MIRQYSCAARGEVIDRFSSRRAFDEGIYATVGAVGEEDGTCLRSEREHVARAVVFLFGARAFVFAYVTGIVFVDGCGERDAGLRVVAHLEAIDIERRHVVLRERRFFDDTAVFLRRAR